MESGRMSHKVQACHAIVTHAAEACKKQALGALPESPLNREITTDRKAGLLAACGDASRRPLASWAPHSCRGPLDALMPWP